MRKTNHPTLEALPENYDCCIVVDESAIAIHTQEEIRSYFRVEQ